MMKKQFKSLILFFGMLATVSLACQTLTSQPGNDAPPLATEAAVVPPQAPSSSGSSAEACAPFDGIPAAAQYASAPDVLINTAGRYTATMRMANGGEIFIELYADKAPITVNNFVFLACKGFYDNTTFHRVLPDFMAQGGDPTGSGMGGPGYEFVNEYSDLSFDKPGILAMANAGPDTNGSQFFITFNAAEWLDGGYTIFGKVLQGMDVVMGITLRDPQTNPSFEGDVLESVTISGE